MKNGLRQRTAARKPILKNNQRKRRLDFACNYINCTAIQWQSVICSDEKIFRAANNRETSLVIHSLTKRFAPDFIQHAPKHSVQVHA